MCTITDLTAIVSEPKMTVSGPTYPTLDAIIAALEPECDDFTADDIAADYASNAPCDFSGFCAGASCPSFHTCKG